MKRSRALISPGAKGTFGRHCLRCEYNALVSFNSFDEHTKVRYHCKDAVDRRVSSAHELTLTEYAGRWTDSTEERLGSKAYLLVWKHGFVLDTAEDETLLWVVVSSRSWWPLWDCETTGYDVIQRSCWRYSGVCYWSQSAFFRSETRLETLHNANTSADSFMLKFDMWLEEIHWEPWMVS